MAYPSDLTDAEWALIQSHFQPDDRRGSACPHPRKRIVDAILYVVKSGCQWRMLPNDFPNCETKQGWCPRCFGTGLEPQGFDAEQSGEELEWLETWRGEEHSCPSCQGRRLRPEAPGGALP